MSKSKSINVSLDKLVLDKDNPRFAELYSGSDDEKEIIEYLLYNESADDVAKAIVNAQEFYPDRPLWVLEIEGGFLVKDGNRRCASVKALQNPKDFNLDLEKIEFVELPVLVYSNPADLDTRIRLEHNSSLFKKWGRIAKALEIYRLFSTGSSIESLIEIDSAPKDLIKLATFYHEACKISGEDFKKLVREGRGKTGGKTIVFERLFKAKNLCGYTFKTKTNEIVIKNKEIYNSYIKAIVAYLSVEQDVTSRVIDKIGPEAFLAKLKPYGFPPHIENTETESTSSDNFESSNNSNTSTSNESLDINIPAQSGTSPISIDSPISPSTNGTTAVSDVSVSNAISSPPITRHSVKSKPILKRKQIPSPLKNLINECYNLDQNNFANSKTALTRVTFECVLKFIVENTMQKNGKPISKSNFFQFAFRDKKNVELPYTNFTVLKTKFTELIIDTSYRKAFEVFDLEIPHQIIHNYRVGAIPKQAKDLCDNLIDLLEFMLQEDVDLISSLDLTKL